MLDITMGNVYLPARICTGFGGRMDETLRGRYEDLKTVYRDGLDAAVNVEAANLGKFYKKANYSSTQLKALAIEVLHGRLFAEVNRQELQEYIKQPPK